MAPCDTLKEEFGEPRRETSTILGSTSAAPRCPAETAFTDGSHRPTPTGRTAVAPLPQELVCGPLTLKDDL